MSEARQGARDEALRPIAREIRRLRTERELSLSALAREAGIAKATLFQLERGEGNPSVETLFGIAKALNVPFAQLFTATGESPLAVQRYEDAAVTARSRPELAVRLMLNRRGGGDVELYLFEFEADLDEHATAHPAGVIEHVIVIDGRVDVGCDGESVELRPGDRLSFHADLPHRYQSIGGPARLLVLFEYPRRTGGGRGPRSVSALRKPGESSGDGGDDGNS